MTNYIVEQYLKRTALKLGRRGRRWRRFKAIVSHVRVYNLQNRYVVNLFFFDYTARSRLIGINRVVRSLLRRRRRERRQRRRNKFKKLQKRFRHVMVTSRRRRRHRRRTARMKKRLVKIRIRRSYPLNKARLLDSTTCLTDLVDRYHRRQKSAVHTWNQSRSTTLGCQVQLAWCSLDPKRHRVREIQSSLKYRLRGRFQRRIKTVVFPLMKRLKKLPQVKGVEFRCHGRFDRQQRAQHKRIMWGVLGTNDPSQKKETIFVTVPLRFGAVGITLLINYGYPV